MLIVASLDRSRQVTGSNLNGSTNSANISNKEISSNQDSADRSKTPWCIRWLILLLMPFLALSLLVATVPPGVLWAEEAHGYDVLEYHLQVPKEFYLSGRLSYLPHNIYSNFPLNAEMLYLLAMVLKGDPLEAAILAKLLNLMLGVLFVIAAWLAGREYHPTVGVLCALIAGSMPWLMYLCGIAYVENGMLFYGMLAAAGLCRYERKYREGRIDSRLALLSGLFAGLACGFKYTAVPMIAGTLLVALGVIALCRTRRAFGMADPALFALGTLITFSPWLIKNVALTGNPVFPLAYDQFGANEEVWSDAQANQWQAAHRTSTFDSRLTARLRSFKERVLLDKRLSVLPLCIAFPILFSKRRSRWDFVVLLVFVLQAAFWIGCTHLFARFAVLMIIPLCILGGKMLLVSPRKPYRIGAACVVLAIVGTNLFSAWSIYSAELIRDGRSWRVHGHTEWFYAKRDPNSHIPEYVRQIISDDDRILMVGDARAYYLPGSVDYCVVFNRNPFAEFVGEASNSEEIIRWLNKKGYRYLLVYWSEMNRLRRTYGFWHQLNTKLFKRLEGTGLAVMKNFRDERNELYATLYEVREFRE